MLYNIYDLEGFWIGTSFGVSEDDAILNADLRIGEAYAALIDTIDTGQLSLQEDT